MKYLVAAAATTLVLAASAVASTTVFMASGGAKNTQPVSGSFVTAQAEDLTVTASFTGKPHGTYLVVLWNAWTNPADAIVCDTYAYGTATSASCTVTAAPAGRWFAEFYPASGKTDVALAVTTP